MCSDMKRVVVLTVVLSMLACSQAFSQSLSKAQERYREFIALANSSSDKVKLYSVSYLCYDECRRVADNIDRNTAAYTEVREMLVSLRPYLKNGAVYHSQYGRPAEALRHAKAYIDMGYMPMFAGGRHTDDPDYARLVYFAASGSYNSGDYKSAARYLSLYLDSRETDHRKDSFRFMADALVKTGDVSAALKTLDEGISEFPYYFEFLAQAIDICQDSELYERLEGYVSKARQMKPDDERLLQIQAMMYEHTGDYMNAYLAWQNLYKKRPQSLSIAKHLAVNCYNVGVLYFNRSISDGDLRTQSRYKSTSDDYFRTAIPLFNDILNVEPASLKYLEGLATIYQCLDLEDRAGTVNDKLLALGGIPVSSSVIPSLVAYEDTSGPSSVTLPKNSNESVTNRIPLYSEYAKEFIEGRLAQWQQKDQFETISEYQTRVTETSRNVKVEELKRQAESSYLSLYARNLSHRDITLMPYDPEHEVFLAESKYGDIIIPVPRAGNEAQIFMSSWNGVRFSDPEYAVSGDRIVLKKMTFITPTGKSYVFDGSNDMEYTETEVDIAFQDISYDDIVRNDGNMRRNVNRSKVTIAQSDVDVDIPVSSSEQKNVFAVVIANENYDFVGNVPMALNDGKVFCDYCEKTLGLPKDNIRYYPDATYGSMLRAIQDINDIAAAFPMGKIRVIFYYSGHGIPDERTKNGYLLPVDADGRQMEVCYPLDKLYSELGSLGASEVVAFLDACFSGSKKTGEAIVAARGVALDAAPSVPTGNMVVFSAASGSETAFPYMDKGHGMFTYYLLKKLKDSKGELTLGELTDYVSEQVRQQSVVVNHKSQTPNVIPSYRMNGTWKNIRLKK